METPSKNDFLSNEKKLITDKNGIALKIDNFSITGYGQCDHPNAELYQLNGKINIHISMYPSYL